MANNIDVTVGAGKTVATEEVAGAQYQYVKLTDATAASSNPTGVAANPLQVSLANTAANATAVKVDGSAVTQPVSAAALPLPTGAATEATLALIKAKTDNLDVALSTRAVTGLTDTQLRASAVPVDASGSTVPVSGPLTDTELRATPVPVSGSFSIGANQTVNLTQLAGTAVDVNSGNKSAGTLRVVIATDQIQLTNALKVDGSAVTQPISAAALPLPTGASTAALQTQPGVDIGDVTVNNGAAGAAVNIQDGGNSITVDAASLPLPTGAATETSLAAQSLVDDAAFGVASSRVTPSGFLADEASTDSVNEGDVGAARITLDRKQIVTEYAHGAGGFLPATGSIAATKTDIGTANTPGTVGGWYFYNPNAAVSYVQFFNAQASAVTLGTTAPFYSVGIPGSSGANIPAVMPGIAHDTAISIAVTTTRAGSTGPGSTVDYNIFYKQ